MLSGRRNDELRRFAVTSPARQLSLQVVPGTREERHLCRVAGLAMLVQVLREEQQFEFWTLTCRRRMRIIRSDRNECGQAMAPIES